MVVFLDVNVEEVRGQKTKTQLPLALEVEKLHRVDNLHMCQYPDNGISLRPVSAETQKQFVVLLPLFG